MNTSRGNPKPSSAADRMPPWLPTRPPSSPDSTPAIHAVAPVNRMRDDSPVSSLAATNNNRIASRINRPGPLTRL
jgi:hypothetical protein